jgi:hypothetical protein
MKNYYYSPLKCSEIAKEIRSEFVQPIPMYLLTKIAWYLKNTGMSLIDSTREAFREKAPKGSKWDKMFYHDDFREILPSAYIEKYLDFEKYPLYEVYE